MKYCPQCQTTYSDDLLKYCLKDGAPLGEVFDSQTPDAASGGEKTAPSIRQVEPIRIPVEQSAPVQNPPAPQNRPQVESPVVAMQTGGRKSKTGSIVALTILGTLLFLGIAGIGAMLYFRNQKTEVAANVNKSPVNRPVNTNSVSAQPSNQTTNQNNNINLNADLPTPTATPKPAIDRRQAEEVADEVEDAIDEWKNATENLDIGGQLSQYAETVDYYTGGRVNRARVRADKDRAFGVYNDVNIKISNLKVTPGESGENATALFDKEWNFEGDANNSSGKVQQQLTLSKIGGKWLITGERDLKVYYVNN
ncbi:MAG TPA: hypothetical protein VNI84_09420 [Pyrinomonadaceae bacterium]|nr:hypothetical protein [Pyrinomonadaceae bacterium]